MFIVGYLGEPCPPEILFEPQSLSRDTQTGREAGQTIANAIRSRSDQGDEARGTLINALNASDHKGAGNQYVADGKAIAIRTAQQSSNGWGIDTERVHTLDGSAGDAIAKPIEEWQQNGGYTSALVSSTLQTSGAGTSRPAGMASEPDFLVTGAPADTDGVRNSTRLSAGLDSERRAEPDSPRYKALGNAVTVNVAEWIGRRILSENNR